MKVYYFTRSGRSEKIAAGVAATFDSKPLRISDGKNWEGGFNYMKAAVMAMLGKSIPASFQKPEPQEQVAVAFPVWAGTFPPAVRSFINEVGRGNIVLLPTSLGSTLRDRNGFAKIIDLVGQEISAPKDI